MTGGKKIESLNEVYACIKCGQLFDFEVAYSLRGEVDQQNGKRKVRCFNPSCENWIFEE